MPKRTDHAGVSIYKMAWKTDPGRAPVWVAKYVDPDDDGRTKVVNLDKEGRRNAKARKAWAKEKSQALAKRRDELAAGAAKRTATPVAGAVKQYLAAKSKKREATRKSYAASLVLFSAWAEESDVGAVETLSRGKLALFRDWLVALPKRPTVKAEKRATATAPEGPRSAAGINHYLRECKAFLNFLRVRDMLPLVDSDAIREALKSEKEEHDPQPLEGDEPRKLLEAALRHDAVTYKETRDEHATGTRGERAKGSTPRYKPMAPFVATVLLSGMRFGEALGLTKGAGGQVRLDALGDDGQPTGEIRLEGDATKTGKRRTIELCVSPGLLAIQKAQIVRAGPGPYVFGGLHAMPRARAEAGRKRLIRAFGAPEFDWQQLRQTCASYLTNAPAIFRAASIYKSAEQLGHAPDVARRHYLGRIKGIPQDARTLDVAMGVKDVLARIAASTKGEHVEATENETVAAAV